MLRMISWQSYLTLIAVLTALYYLVITIIFYRHDLLALAGGHGKAPKEGDKKDEKPELFKATEKAIGMLTGSLQEIKINGGNKADVLSTAKDVLKKYAYLKGTPYAIAVNHFLLRETSTSIPLTEEEIRELWE